MRLFRFFQKEDLGLSFLFVLLLLFFVDPAISMAGAEERSADAIAKKANLAAYYPGDDSLARVQFSITNARGKNRRREFVVLHRDEEDGGDQFFYVFFKNPPDVRRMAYLVWKHVDRDDDRWLYLPADRDGYLRPKVHYRITDQWAADLGANLFAKSRDDAFFGQYENNTNVYFGLRYSF